MNFDRHQSAAVNAPPEKKILVVAGAGTGKTRVMLERLIAIATSITQEQFGPILVLSFTNAITAEIGNTIRALPGATKYVRARTLNSFADQVLRENFPDDSWRISGYDQRINLASELIRTQSLRIPLNPRHIFIDEIQDLVGPRLDMTKNLLSSCGSGFTLMGDPAQAIYSHDQTVNKSDEDIFSWVRKNFSDLSEFSFSTNYRATSEHARTALPEGDALRNENPDYSAIFNSLVEKLCHNDDIPLMDFNAGLLRLHSKSMAILSRTNCETLIFSEILQRKKVPHSIRLRSDERGIKPWAGKILQGIPQSRITEARYRTRLDELSDLSISVEEDSDECWSLLKRLSRSDANVVNTSVVGDSISKGRYPTGMSIEHDSALILSTIHAAKGLEFNTVVVTEPDPGFVHDDDYGSAARLLFVAMTRTQDLLFYCDRPAMTGWSTRWLGYSDSTPRWTRRTPPIWRGVPTGLEFRPSDTDSNKLPPYEDENLKSLDEWYSKIYQSAVVENEVEVTLKFFNRGVIPSYKVLHNKTGICLGFTSDKFGELLASMHAGPRPLPTLINGLRINGFESVVSENSDEQTPIRIWAKPSIIGLAIWE